VLFYPPVLNPRRYACIQLMSMNRWKTGPCLHGSLPGQFKRFCVALHIFVPHSFPRENDKNKTDSSSSPVLCRNLMLVRILALFWENLTVTRLRCDVDSVFLSSLKDLMPRFATLPSLLDCCCWATAANSAIGISLALSVKCLAAQSLPCFPPRVCDGDPSNSITWIFWLLFSHWL